MSRAIDHLVLCVRELDAARAFYARLGFTLTPRAQHPWGTANFLAQLQGNFLEILTVADRARIPPARTGEFSFGRFNADFLAKRQGFSMLVLQSADARADQAAFAKAGLDTYPPFDFERQATLPDGGTARVAFSLAFVTHPKMPQAAFFCCQQHAPQYFWKPEYQKHQNGALSVAEAVMRAPDPAVFADFFARMQGKQAVSKGRGSLEARAGEGKIAVLDEAGIARRYPGMEFGGDAGSPAFVGYRIAVGDLGAAEALLGKNGVPVKKREGALIVDPADAFGAAIEFAAA